jgi:hypothetical protein
MKKTKLESITVLISSCDAYSILWPSFSKWFFKNWKIECELIFVSETQKHPDFKTILTGKIPWAHRNLVALSQIKSDYVFWLLEDYFLTREFHVEEMERYLNDFIEKKMDRLQLAPQGVHKNYDFDVKNTFKPEFNYSNIPANHKYSISMQPSIWRKDYILKVLNKDYTPWEFELIGSINNSSSNIFIDKSIVCHPYFNVAKKKHVRNLTWAISKIDKIIEAVFYKKLPFNFNKGYKKFIK